MKETVRKFLTKFLPWPFNGFFVPKNQNKPNNCSVQGKITSISYIENAITVDTCFFDSSALIYSDKPVKRYSLGQCVMIDYNTNGKIVSFEDYDLWEKNWKKRRKEETEEEIIERLRRQEFASKRFDYFCITLSSLILLISLLK